MYFLQLKSVFQETTLIKYINLPPFLYSCTASTLLTVTKWFPLQYFQEVFPFHGQPTVSHRDCELNSEQGFFSSGVSVGTYRHIQLPDVLHTKKPLKSLSA